MKRTKKSSLLTVTAGIAGLAMGAGIAMAAHPPIPLYTYEEVAQQYGAPVMPVMASRLNNQGMPYSPKQTCSTATPGINTGTCHDYKALADHAFHASLGFNEWMDNDDSGLFIGDGTGATAAGIQTGLNPQKPWLQSHGHNGKW